MLVVDLVCEHGHRFEGWFASGVDLASQQSRGLLTCPVCGDAHVVRVPSASHVVTTQHSKPDAGPSEPMPASEPTTLPPQATSVAAQHGGEAPDSQVVRQLQALWLNTVRDLVNNTEDVGARFPQEVRAMHHGDAPERAVRGQATPDERQALRDEGIEVIALPVPDALKGSVH